MLLYQRSSEKFFITFFYPNPDKELVYLSPSSGQLDLLQWFNPLPLKHIGTSALLSPGSIFAQLPTLRDL